jgi:subtilisin family serine protease
MAKFIVKFDLDFFTSADEIEAEISSNAVTIDSKLTFPGTYVLVAEEDAITAMIGVLMYEKADTVVTAKLQEYSTKHIDILDNDYEAGVQSTPQFTGAGQEIYLIDTGIKISHPQFTGASISNLWSNFDGDFDDVAGHGTAVGSLIVGQNIGTAPNATLHNIKLFNAPQGEITIGEIITAFDAILEHHSNTQGKAKVVCMPWTIGKNAFVDSKVEEMNQGNLVVVCAAGNDGADVNTVSPAGVDSAITVGAMDGNFSVAPFTNSPFASSGTYNCNFGAQLDIFALGVDVTYANLLGTYDTGSGTSFASGIVAGVAAEVIEKFATLSAADIKDNMLAEGHTRGTGMLSFDATSGIDYTGVYKSVATVDKQGFVPFATLNSGRIANLRIGEDREVPLGLHPEASDVVPLEFAPLPDWINLDNPHVLSMDATVDPALAPGVYIFAIKGEVAGDMTVEEYSVGLYLEDVSELEGAKSYYYDADAQEYDEVVNYQVAPSGKN